VARQSGGAAVSATSVIEATAPEPAAAHRSPLVSASIGLAVLVAVLLAVVASLVSSRTASNKNSTPTGGYLAGPDAIAAQAAASTEARATLTYSYQSLAADFAAAERGLTPHFRTSYQSTTAQSVTPLATKYHAISTATVTNAGVSAATAQTATVLLFVDQTVQNTQLAHPRLDRSRIRVSMVKLNGRWLIDNLSPI
jgi:Mce-associated membrane protein